MTTAAKVAATKNWITHTLTFHKYKIYEHMKDDKLRMKDNYLATRQNS